MAIKDYFYLDEAGVQVLSNHLLNKVNTRISERILKDPTGTDIANVDDSHVISAAAIMNLLGTNSGNIGDRLDDIKNDLENLENQMHAYTHLKIQTHIGDIEDVLEPEENVFYFQKDAPVMDRDDEGFLIDSEGRRVTATGDDSQPYYAYIDPITQEVVKHDGSGIVQSGSSNVVLDGEDPIFEQVNIIEDTTWTIYAYIMTKATHDSEPALQWINFGDFDVELQNYWSKSDEDVAELKDKLGVPNLTSLTEEKIQTAVDGAFAATAPSFEKRQTNVTLNFVLGDISVGTEQVSATIGEEKVVQVTEMQVPVGHTVDETVGESVKFTALHDDTTVDVKVKKTEEDLLP